MRIGWLAWVLLFWFLSVTPAWAKDAQTPVQTWRVGVIVNASRGPARGVFVSTPIPKEWPEQRVNVLDQELSPHVRRLTYRTLADGARQMVVEIPRIGRGESATAMVTLQISKNAPEPLADPGSLKIPHRPSAKILKYLNPSPLIESHDRTVRKQIKEIVDGVDGPWEQVRAIYTWVTSEIENRPGTVAGAKKTLPGKAGSPEDLRNVFIVLCRSHKVPARMVWADNGEYAEFYLQDDTGKGKWYPVVLEGKKEFGQMTDPRVIIQKGDNIKVPEKNKRQRFVVEFVTGSGKNSARPRVQFLRDLLPSRDVR